MQRKCSITYLSRRPVASFSLCIALVLVVQILIIFSWNSSWAEAEQHSQPHQEDAAGLLPVVKYQDSDGRILGLDPKLQSLYKIGSDGLFSCLDKSGQVPAAFLNDDYCDCEDGSDEPSTSACPRQQFHCAKSGLVIPSSRGHCRSYQDIKSFYNLFFKFTIPSRGP